MAPASRRGRLSDSVRSLPYGGSARSLEVRNWLPNVSRHHVRDSWATVPTNSLWHSHFHGHGRNAGTKDRWLRAGIRQSIVFPSFPVSYRSLWPLSSSHSHAILRSSFVLSPFLRGSLLGRRRLLSSIGFKPRSGRTPRPTDNAAHLDTARSRTYTQRVWYPKRYARGGTR